LYGLYVAHTWVYSVKHINSNWFYVLTDRRIHEKDRTNLYKTYNTIIHSAVAFLHGAMQQT